MPKWEDVLLRNDNTTRRQVHICTSSALTFSRRRRLICCALFSVLHSIGVSPWKRCSIISSQRITSAFWKGFTESKEIPMSQGSFSAIFVTTFKDVKCWTWSLIHLL